MNGLTCSDEYCGCTKQLRSASGTLLLGENDVVGKEVTQVLVSSKSLFGLQSSAVWSVNTQLEKAIELPAGSCATGLRISNDGSSESSEQEGERFDFFDFMVHPGKTSGNSSCRVGTELGLEGTFSAVRVILMGRSGRSTRRGVNF
jgi:hypothetical protein